MPLVSVIIPNYNHAPFLTERIDSVLNQTFTDFEMIILDDKSPDNSQEIINRYKDHPKVAHIIFNEVNGKNTFTQWEKGLALATGKYIWIAESDDKAAPDFLASLLRGFQDNDKVCLAFCESYFIDQYNKEVQSRKPGKTSFTLPGEQFVKDYMLTRNRVYNASMAIFKKENFINYVTPDYKDFKYCGDYFMWTQLALSGDVFYLNRKLNYFRRHTTSVSFTSDKKGLGLVEGIRVLNYINKRLKLSSRYFFTTTKYLANQLAHQAVILNAIDKDSQCYVYKELKLFHSSAAWLIPAYTIQKKILYPLYVLKKIIAKK